MQFIICIYMYICISLLCHNHVWYHLQCSSNFWLRLQCGGPNIKCNVLIGSLSRSVKSQNEISDQAFYYRQTHPRFCEDGTLWILTACVPSCSMHFIGQATWTSRDRRNGCCSSSVWRLNRKQKFNWFNTLVTVQDAIVIVITPPVIWILV